jgi:hypothetical protein
MAAFEARSEQLRNSSPCAVSLSSLTFPSTLSTRPILSSSFLPEPLKSDRLEAGRKIGGCKCVQKSESDLTEIPLVCSDRKSYCLNNFRGISGDLERLWKKMKKPVY